MAFRIELHATDLDGYTVRVPSDTIYPTEALARRAAPRVIADTWDGLDAAGNQQQDITYQVVEARPAQVLAFPGRLS